MKQILILVEGQTEEQFIKNALNAYLNKYDIHLNPTIINTKIIKGGSNFKGGIVSYNQVKRDILRLVQTNSLTVTTFIDYYGLPIDFPGISNSGTTEEKVLAIENSFYEDIQSNNFIPYIQIHEFEALLFSSTSGFEFYFPEEYAQLEMIRNITRQYLNPEDINNNKLTAPSKRILSIFPNYEKPLFGTLIALEVKIEIMLEKCPHFSHWVKKLIAL